MSTPHYNSFIHQFLENIEYDIKHNKLAIFVGSGISRCSNYPSWEDVIQQFAKPLGLPTNNLTSKDFLEIPDKFLQKYQYFEYKKLLEKIFNITPTTLKLQEKILKINPYHIVTTNWDELLEDAMLNVENRFYDIVHDDSDLAKVNNTKLIIKMHGTLSKLDGNNNAIVMREQDYLSYSDNFPLIENFVKSIFSTKRVVFIGYSLSDYNVQQIIHWVRNRTHNHIYPYLIVDGPYNEVDFNFYKEKGIFLLYLDEIFSFTKQQVPEHYLDKYDSFLEIILERDIYLEQDISILEKLKNILHPYDNINFIGANILREILKKKLGLSSSYDLFGDRTLYLNEQKNNKEINNVCIQLRRLSKAFEKHGKLASKFKLHSDALYVLNKLQKNHIDAISLDIEAKRICNLKPIFNYLSSNNEFNLFGHMLNFDFQKIIDYINETLSLPTKKNEHSSNLAKAYAFYQLNKYDEALTILKQLLKATYLDKQFFLYFIVKMNLQHLCFIKSRTFHVDWKVHQDLCDKYKIDSDQLQQEIYNLPSEYQNELIHKVINLDYFYEQFYQIQTLHDKNLKTKEFFINSGSANNMHHAELFNKTLDLFLFLNLNFIMIDRYEHIRNIFTKAFQALIVNYSIIVPEDASSSRGIYFPPNQFKKLNQFVMYLALKSTMQFEDLSNFIIQEIKTSEKEYKYLEFQDIDNIINEMMPNILQIPKKGYDQSSDEINKLIVVLSLSILNDEYIEKILNVIIEKIEDDTHWVEYNVINLFLVNQADYINNTNLEVLQNIFEMMIKKAYQLHTTQVRQLLEETPIAENCIQIFKKHQYQLTTNISLISTLGDELHWFTGRDKAKNGLYYLATIYSLNPDFYTKLKEGHIKMVLKDIEGKIFNDKDAYFAQIYNLLGEAEK